MEAVLTQALKTYKIVKRDGRLVDFNITKISNAINKAFTAQKQYVSEEFCLDLAKEVFESDILPSENAPTVEEVQDAVELLLLKKGYAQVAKAYIHYRTERSKIREMNSSLMKIYEDITFSSAKESDLKRENANVDGDTAMGTMLKYGSEGSKHFSEMFLLKPEHSKAHKSGDIHIHDLDFLTLTTTCCQIDLIKLFKDGYSTGHGYLREPNDILSYSALACIAIQSNQNDQHGGQSVPNFDYAMGLGVRKTYRKNYRKNLSKAFTLMFGADDARDLVKEVGLSVLNEGHELRINDNQSYRNTEKAIFVEKGFDAILVERAQAFALKEAWHETDKATFQAMEALVHNLNTMNSRAGAQTPFSSINYGTDTSEEGRMVVRNLLLALESGLGNGETPIFPIHIFRVKESINLNPDAPNYDLFKLACRVSAKRLFPNFSFQDAPFNAQYLREGRPETEISYMGCRTRVIGNTFDPNNEITFGRGNLSFTSINLPRIAIQAQGNKEAFFEKLNSLVDLCVDQLLERFKIQASKKVKNYPFLMGQNVWLGSENLSYEDSIGEVLKHGTLTVGFIGLAEALVVLTGKHHGESELSQKLGVEIVSFMRKKTDEESKKHLLNFSLIATPAEGLSGRFVKIDRNLFGEIQGVTDREYYTNSFHVPVYYKIGAFDKIQIEAPYHALTNAGHITYVELDGDLSKNLDAFEKVIRTMHQSGIGYGSINHPVDRDPVCGFTGVINDECPKCGRHEDGDIYFERIRRITGYLVGTLDRFNNAKQAEVRNRVKHGVK
ncbi:MAG: nrdD [Bacillales bacterium]|jgi:ribonucleoside-triphosphate reductase|nr:nrdD [Bacillales bacterium]